MRAGKQSLLRGFLWLGSASAVAKLVDLGAIIVVLGVVSPHQVGEASLAWTVVTLSEPLVSLGVQWGLLTVRHLDRRTLEAGLWLSIAGGLVGTAGVAAVAPLIAGIAHAPASAPLIAFGALKLLPVAIASLPQQRLARALRQREIATASVVATLLSAAIRVLLALRGWGAWSFVVAQNVYSLALLVCLWLCAPLRPRLRFDFARARELLRLGIPSTLGQTLTQWARNVDYVLVGALLGMTPLGLYRVAFDLAMEPVVATGDVVAKSATPTLRKLAGSRERLGEAFAYANKLTLLTALPLAAGTFVLAPVLLQLTKDASFLPATSVTRWLVVAAVMRVVLGLYTPLAIAIGRPNLALRASLDLFALLLVALLLCLWALGGVLSIAAAGVAWCAAVGLALLITRTRFRSALHPPPVPLGGT